MGRISGRWFVNTCRNGLILTLALAGGCGGGAAKPAPTADAAVTSPVGRPVNAGDGRVAVAAAPTPLVTLSPPTFAGPKVGTAVAADQPITEDQVVGWATQGTRDDVIIDRIERSRAVFRLSPTDEQHLRQQGVSADVIVAMRESCWR